MPRPGGQHQPVHAQAHWQETDRQVDEDQPPFGAAYQKVIALALEWLILLQRAGGGRVGGCELNRR